MTDPAPILSDLLRAALDDCRVKLPTLAQRRVLDRMVELAAINGYELAAATTITMLTTAELAGRWRTDRGVVLAAINRDEVPCLKLGGKWLIPTAWVEAQEHPPT